MPQLRDSGNHSSSPLDEGTLREVHSFARIFGIETEYGVSVTGCGCAMRRQPDGNDDVPADRCLRAIDQYVY